MHHKIGVFTKNPGPNFGSLEGSEFDVRNDQKWVYARGEKKARMPFLWQNRFGEVENAISVLESAWRRRECTRINMGRSEMTFCVSEPALGG